MQGDSFREQRRRALAQQQAASLPALLTRAADGTRRATEQLGTRLADGLTAALPDAAQFLKVPFTRLSGLKGRRTVYSDELAPGLHVTGGDNSMGVLGVTPILPAETGQAAGQNLVKPVEA